MAVILQIPGIGGALLHFSVIVTIPILHSGFWYGSHAFPQKLKTIPAKHMVWAKSESHDPDTEPGQSIREVSECIQGALPHVWILEASTFFHFPILLFIFTFSISQPCICIP